MDNYALFTEFLSICNAAAEVHRERFPFKQLIEESERALGQRRIRVEIYNQDPGAPCEFFIIGIRSGALCLLGHGEHESADIGWKVKRAYLEQVTKDPVRYIAHPTCLDFDWIAHRLDLQV